MSSNIYQVFLTNPTTTFQSNDLMYLGRSPYAAPDDFGFTYSSLIPINTKGDLFTWSSAATRVAVGSNSSILMADSSQTTGLKWTTTTYPSVSVGGDIIYASANNTFTTLAGNSTASTTKFLSQASNGSGVPQTPAWNSLTGSNIGSTKFLCQDNTSLPPAGINLNDPTVSVAIGTLPTDPNFGLATLSVYDNSTGSSEGFPLLITTETSTTNAGHWLVGYISTGVNMIHLSTLSSHGTSGSPTAINNNDILFSIDVNGQYSTSSSSYAYSGAIQCTAAANFTSTTNHQTNLKFLTSNSGDTSPVERVRIANTGLLTAFYGISATTLTLTTTPLALTSGGTAASLTASNGGIVYSTASAMAILAGTSTANRVLLSGSSAAPSWSTATYLSTSTANRILYSSATNTISEITSANSAVLVTNSSGVPSFTSTMTDGQVVIGSTSGTPTVATLTAGIGIVITNASGSITISSPDSGIQWNSVSGTTQALTVNNGYVNSNAALTTYTLPSVAAIGDVISIRGQGAGGYTVAQNASQIIHVGSTATTTGVGGSVSSINRYTSFDLTCVVANTEFVVTGLQGTLTIV